MERKINKREMEGRVSREEAEKEEEIDSQERGGEEERDR